MWAKRSQNDFLARRRFDALAVKCQGIWRIAARCLLSDEQAKLVDLTFCAGSGMQQIAIDAQPSINRSLHVSSSIKFTSQAAVTQICADHQAVTRTRSRLFFVPGRDPISLFIVTHFPAFFSLYRTADNLALFRPLSPTDVTV